MKITRLNVFGLYYCLFSYNLVCVASRTLHIFAPVQLAHFGDFCLFIRCLNTSRKNLFLLLSFSVVAIAKLLLVLTVIEKNTQDNIGYVFFFASSCPTQNKQCLLPLHRQVEKTIFFLLVGMFGNLKKKIKSSFRHPSIQSIVITRLSTLLVVFLAFEILFFFFSPSYNDKELLCVYQWKNNTRIHTIREDSPSFFVQLGNFFVRKKEFGKCFSSSEKFFFLRKRPIIRNESKEGVDAGTLQHGYLITPATNKDRTTITKRDTNRKKK